MVRILVFICMLALNAAAFAANITAQFDRNPVQLGDPVTLRFSANGIVNGEPDFKPLESQFDIRAKAQSNSFNLINGNTSMQTVWELTLHPQKTGVLTVPEIDFGGDKSNTLTLEVTDKPIADPAQAAVDDVFVEVSIETPKPWVQQQVMVMQRLFYMKELQPQAALSIPKITAGSGSLHQLGKNRQLTMLRNGHNYHVIERRLVLFPQQSGTITLGESKFEGAFYETGNGFDPFGMNSPRIQRLSTPISIEVQAQPATYSGKDWLPAKNVTLNAHWQIPPTKLKAGEPVTLTLAIMAEGLTAEQLPPLSLNAPAPLKAYADKPELRTEFNSNNVIGVRNERWVVMSPYNGDFELPAITLNWWNTATNTMETAQITPVKLTVTGGQAAPSNVTTSPTAPTTNAAPTPELGSNKNAATESNALSFAQIGLLLLGIWLVLSALWLIWLWWRRSKVPVRRTQEMMQPASTMINVQQQLVAACERHDPVAAQDAVLMWAQQRFNIHPLVMYEVRKIANPALTTALDELENALYGRAGHLWDGRALLDAINTYPTQEQLTKQATTSLVNLYPD